MESKPPICFTCGQTTETGTRLNRTDDGRVCPACADRLLADLPALLPGHGRTAEELAAEAEPEPVERPRSPGREGA